MNQNTFETLHEAGSARAGLLHTAHGEVATPAVCVIDPWGLDPDEIRAAEAQMVAVSSFALQPGSAGSMAAREGGIHRFLRWDGPILMDAGSALIFGLPSWGQSPQAPGHSSGHGRLERLDPDGVTFTSPVDGSRQRLTPESVLSEMATLGPDLMVPLFPPASLPGKKQRGVDLLALTVDWAERAVAVGPGPGAILLGVPYRSDPAVASQVLAVLTSFHPAGYALDGEDAAAQHPVVGGLPAGGVRFFSAAATPASVEYACAAGIDVVGWHARAGAAEGFAFTTLGAIRLTEEAHRVSPIPLDPECACPACSFSRAYLHHLFAASELLGPRLVALHNLTYVCRLVEQRRAALIK